MKERLNFIKELPQEGNIDDIAEFLSDHWGSIKVVSRGKVTDATLIPRIVVRGSNNSLVGLATYLIDRETQNCELVSINSDIEGFGIGTKLIGMVEADAKENGCKRIWLITTNDNPEAAAFYVKRGYRLTKVHLNILEKSRELKPQIPKVGKHGIPLLDEWEFEKLI